MHHRAPAKSAQCPHLIRTIHRPGLAALSTNTGVSSVDRLNIVAHDRFREIINEANRPDSTIRMQQVILDSDGTSPKTRTRWSPKPPWPTSLG